VPIEERRLPLGRHEGNVGYHQKVAQVLGQPADLHGGRHRAALVARWLLVRLALGRQGHQARIQRPRRERHPNSAKRPELVFEQARCIAGVVRIQRRRQSQ
jgi:hypothetical protein